MVSYPRRLDLHRVHQRWSQENQNVEKHTIVEARGRGSSGQGALIRVSSVNPSGDVDGKPPAIDHDLSKKYASQKTFTRSHWNALKRSEPQPAFFSPAGSGTRERVKTRKGQCVSLYHASVRFYESALLWNRSESRGSGWSVRRDSEALRLYANQSRVVVTRRVTQLRSAFLPASARVLDQAGGYFASRNVFNLRRPSPAWFNNQRHSRSTRRQDICYETTP